MVCRTGERRHDLASHCEIVIHSKSHCAQFERVLDGTVCQRSLVPAGVTAMSRKRYVGPIPHLSGKTASVWPRVGVPGQVMAQFEEQHLQEARYWWQFPECDFQATGPKTY